ncbi:unnamed protein product [Meganyctiphanes norvegica]|uniref:DNA repair protein complementing XP-G cells n=1 Tax=Meganyctiphanes norvegica TaxID=48144 RepID=A0AAV2SLE7_MEGNR
MGVKGLWKLIEAAGMPVALETLEHKILGVDISIWLHQAVRGWKGPGGDSVANAHLLTLFHRICKLLFYRIRPVFVFDGGVPYLKKQTLANRRLRREVAASTATKVRERLLNNLLKSQAVRQALGKHGPGPAAFHVPKAPRKTDMFELPPLPVKEEKEEKDEGKTSLDSDSSDDETTSLLLNINVPNLHQFDVESQEFKSLPLESQSIILSELALTRKQNSWGIVNEMPEEGNDFSTFQMGRLLKRRTFQKTIEGVQVELQKKNMAEMEAEMFGELEKHASFSQRIVSEENATSILVKTVDEKEEKKDVEYKGKSLMKKKVKIQKDFLKELASKGLSTTNNEDSAIKDDSKKFDLHDSFSDDSEDDDFFKKEKKDHEASLMRIMDTVVDNSGLTQEELLAIIKQDGNENSQKVNDLFDDQPSTSSNAGGFVYNVDADSSSDDTNDFVEIVDNVRKKLCSENEKKQDTNIDAILSSKSSSLYLKIVQDRVNDMLHTNKFGKTAPIDTRRPGNTPVKENLTPATTPVKDATSKLVSPYKRTIPFDTTFQKVQAPIKDINDIPDKSTDKPKNETSSDDDDDDFIEVPLQNHLKEANVDGSNLQKKVTTSISADDSSSDDDFIEVPIPGETNHKPQDSRHNFVNSIENPSDDASKVTVDLTFGPTVIKDDLFADLFPVMAHSSLPEVVGRTDSNGRIENGQKDTNHFEEEESPVIVNNHKNDTKFSEVNIEKSTSGLPSASNNEIDPELKRRIDELVKLEIEKIIGKKIDVQGANVFKSPKDLGNESKNVVKPTELMDTSDDTDDEILIQSSSNEDKRQGTPNLSESPKSLAASTVDSEEFDSVDEDAIVTRDYSSCMFVKEDLIPEHMKVPFILPTKLDTSNKNEAENNQSLEIIKPSVKDNLVETEQIQSPIADYDKKLLNQKDSLTIESERSKSLMQSHEQVELESTASREREVNSIDQPKESSGTPERKESLTLVEAIEQPLKYSEDELKLLEGNLAEEQQLLVAQAQKVDRVASNLSEQVYIDAQELLQLFGLPYLVAPMEAEAQCAFLDYMNMTQGSITDDSDVFLFGGTRVYKNLFNQNRQVEFYNTLNVQNHFNLDRDKLITLALLTGSDYTEGIESIGAVSAMEILAEFSGEGVECLRNLKKWWNTASNRVSASHPSNIRQKLSQLSLPESFPNPDVYKAYKEPDVDDSTEKFTWAVPNVNSLRAFTTEKFGWSMAKSGEILTPVMKRLGVKETQMRIDSFFTSIKLVKEPTNTSKRMQDAISRVRGEEPPPRSNSNKGPSGISRKRGASNASGTSKRKKSKLMEETLDTNVVDSTDMKDPDDPNNMEDSDDCETSFVAMESEKQEAESSSSNSGNKDKKSGPALRIPTEASEVHSQPAKKLTKEEFKEEMYKAMLNREGITQVQNEKKEMEERKKKAALLLKNKAVGKKSTYKK